MLANTIAKRIGTEIKLICYVKDGRKGNIERELECAVCVGDRVERKEGEGVLEEGRKEGRRRVIGRRKERMRRLIGGRKEGRNERMKQKRKKGTLPCSAGFFCFYGAQLSNALKYNSWPDLSGRKNILLLTTYLCFFASVHFPLFFFRSEPIYK